MKPAFAPARRADLPQLVALLGILFTQEAELEPDAARQERGLKRILGDPARARIYVAREGARVLAMCALHYTTSTAEGGKVAWFEDFVVHPDFRGRGIGRRLIRFVLAQARKDRLLRVMLLTDGHNRRAQALYRRAGFTASKMLPMRLRLRAAGARRRSSRG